MGYSRCRFASSHRKSGDGFSTGAVHTMDKLFEGIRSITTRIYKGLVIVEKGCANLTRFMGFWWAKHSQAAYNQLWSHSPMKTFMPIT